MKTIKKALSLALAVIMLLSCFSAAALAYDGSHLPQIYIEGFVSKEIYHKDDVNQEKSLFFPIDVNDMFANLAQYEKHLKNAVAKGDPDLLYSYICLWMEDYFGLIALKPDGYTSHEDVVVPETELNHRGNGKYVFRFDSRLDPVDIAAELKEYVKMVQDATDSTRYELAASSFGTSIALAFLNKYPEEHTNIDSLVLCVPASNGVNFAGELFSGSFNIDPDALEAFIDNMEINDDLTLFLSVLNKTGTLDAILEAFLEPALKAALLRAMKTVVHDIFGTMPGMWTYVDDRYFYDALEYTYGEDYMDPDHEHAGLIAKVIYYHENILLKTDDILLEAQGDNIKANIIAKYGSAPLPLSKEGNFTGDGFVALEKASFGATCLQNGEKLPENYVQAKHPEYNMISPDRCVDASTCLLPFNTWFIKNLAHGDKPDSYFELINTILYEDINITYPKYPQFLQIDPNNSEAIIIATADEEVKKETSWLQDFLTLIPRLLKMLIAKLKEVFVK